MRARTLTQVLLGAGIMLGIAAGGCYGDYAGTTTGGGTGATSDPGTDGGGSTATGIGSGGEAGGAPAANAPAGGTPTMNFNYGTASTCTSGTTWTQGTRGSSSMEPGQSCNACHSSSGGEGPSFFVAGTVYPSAHEPDNCNGIANIKVVITDAAGKVATLTTNSAGNFSCSTRTCAGFKYPYNAYVENSSGVYRQMAAAQSSPDCNSCHTEAGANNAPGRIMAP